MKLSIIQLCVIDGNPEKNLLNAEKYLSLAPKGALVLLPELWSSGYDFVSVPRIAEHWTPLILARLSEIAAKFDQTIGGSLVSIGDNSKLVNRFWLVSPNSPPVYYDKGHLFPAFNECAIFEGGRKRVTCRVGNLKVGLSVCFDLRFAEQYRLDALNGAEAFLICAAWPEIRVDVMHTLARARAIENQAFVVLSNRAGRDSSGQIFGGQSVVIDPFGNSVASGGLAEALIISELEEEDVTRCRQKLNCLALRKRGLDF